MVIPRTLAELFHNPDPPPELASLVLARDEYPNLSIEDHLRALADLASPLAPRLSGLRRPIDQAAVLGTYVYDELGFRGNEDDYHDPRNSYLNEVLARRTGLPITLAVVLLALGRRAGITVEGVGFPGHFLVRLGGTEGIFLDPFFHARILEREALEALAKRALGPQGELLPEHLAPVGTRAITARILTNLKHTYEQRGDHARALVVCDRLVDLTGALELRRDRGLHALALGALEAASPDLEAWLKARPEAPDARAVRASLERARAAKTSRLN